MGVHEFIPSEPPSELPFVTAEFLYRSGEHEQYPWKSLPWQGISKKVLFFDPFSGVTFDLVKMEQGATFPEHYLTTTQVTYLLEGRLRRDDGTIICEASFHFVRAGEVQTPIKAETEIIQLRYFASVPVYILSDGSTFVTKSDGTVVAAGRLNFVGGAKPRNIISP